MTNALAPHPILRIRSPVIGKSEQVFELAALPVTIGRAADCDIVLLEQSASRVHARLLPEDGGWTLVDEDSHAGVYVGTARIRRHKLSDGERFRIGETEFQLVLRPASQPTLVGATIHPRPSTPVAARAPEVEIGSAPTIASGAYAGDFAGLPSPSSESTAPVDAPRRGTPAGIGAAPPVMPSADFPPASAPPVASARPPQLPLPLPPPPPPPPPPLNVAMTPPLAPPVAPRPAPRAPAPVGSAPSFVDFGPVGRPGAEDDPSFAGQLVDDPSRIAEAQPRVTSRWGTWLVVVVLFIGLSLLVVSLAYDITLSDVMSAFD